VCSGCMGHSAADLRDDHAVLVAGRRPFGPSYRTPTEFEEPTRPLSQTSAVPSSSTSLLLATTIWYADWACARASERKVQLNLGGSEPIPSGSVAHRC
jgi:hypothetical protein